MGPVDLQRYKKLLQEKQRELLSAKPGAETRVPPAGGWEGDLILTKRMPMPKRIFRSACIRPMVVSYERSKRHSRG
jgi:hypothetical protein